MKKSIGAKTILYPTPTLVIGSYDEAGKPNVMTTAWGGICCSVPPCVSISLRKATYTYGNILSRKAFTVNIPSENQAEMVDYFGIASGKTVDKLAASGLTPVKSELVDAPYVDEFTVVLECQVIHIYEIGVHTQFIGEIMDVKADTRMFNEEGTLSPQKIKPMAYSPDDRHYFGLGRDLGKAHSIGRKLMPNR